MDSRARRVAQNEALGRQINEELRRLEPQSPDEPLQLVCECADGDCQERVEISWSQYEQIRNNPHRFVTVDGHEMVGVEVVVDRAGPWLVVEKVAPDARDVAESTDPRESDYDGVSD